MSKPIDDTAENEWARANIRAYLLGRLDETEEERFTADVAVLDELVDELGDAERDLITEFLTNRIPDPDRTDFVRCYLAGSERQRIAFRVQEALYRDKLNRGAPARRAQNSQSALPVVRPVTTMRAPLRRGAWLGIAAGIAFAISTGFAFYEWRSNHDLESRIAAMNSRNEERPVEQPAGQGQPAGLVLDASPRASTELTVDQQPARLIWQPVPDYRDQYRIRIRTAAGTELTSPLLIPIDNAIAFTIANPSSLQLPWQVFVQKAGQLDNAFLSRYTLTRR